MNIMKHADLFNKNTMTVFTDASCIKIHPDDKKYLTSSAVQVYIADRIISSEVYLFKESTISIAELFAVYKGVLSAYQLLNENIQITHLFSDSSYSISGLTDWLKKWVYSGKDTVFYNSKSIDVANQQFYHAIISFINYYSFNIRFHKVRGHIDINIISEVEKAGHYINTNNYLFKENNLDENCIYTICKRNNLVDNLANSTLMGNLSNAESFQSTKDVLPIYFLDTTASNYLHYINNIKYNI